MKTKILSLIITVAMLSAGTAAFAEESGIMLISENPYSEKVIATRETQENVILDGAAKITEENELTLVNEDEITVINYDENTVFVSADGNKISADEIKDGDIIRVAASSATTRSIPPQTYGYVVICGSEEDMMPIYAEVGSVETEDDAVFFLSKDGNYKVTYSDETAFAPLATKNIVKAEDIAEGSRILVYSDMMTMSIPALVPAQKIVVLPEAEEASVPEKILLNDAEINAEIKDINGEYFLPVRKICEGAGLEVEWNDSLKAVSIGSTQMGVNFNIGVNLYKKAKMMGMTLSSAPVVFDGTTYAPIDFFTEVLEADVVNQNGAISISLNVSLD